jgi:hypothetical protein
MVDLRGLVQLRRDINVPVKEALLATSEVGIGTQPKVLTAFPWPNRSRPSHVFEA